MKKNMPLIRKGFVLVEMGCINGHQCRCVGPRGLGRTLRLFSEMTEPSRPDSPERRLLKGRLQLNS